MSAVVVFTTVGDGFDARGLARELVELRVAACVNIVERITSIYAWEGDITEDGEQLLVIKTTEAMVAALQEALFSRHPYSVPEFVVMPATASDAYGAWLADSTGPRR